MVTGTDEITDIKIGRCYLRTDGVEACRLGGGAEITKGIGLI